MARTRTICPTTAVSLRELCLLPCVLALVTASTTTRAEAPSEKPAGANKSNWQIVESENFRLLSYGPRPTDSHLAADCEALRQTLMRQWLPDDETIGWRPKCDLVLHPHDGSYLRAVGAGGRSTVASALVEHRAGRVAVRRIDIRASRQGWRSEALPHELMHVIIADRFDNQTLPRWIDEGIAIQADSAEKRRGHRRGSLNAIARGTQFRLPELLQLADYPAAGRWSVFYDQSATLVDFLVAQRDAGAFLKFVEISQARGYHHAAQTVYGATIAQLEARWHAELADRTAYARRSPSIPFDPVTPVGRTTARQAL